MDLQTAQVVTNVTVRHVQQGHNVTAELWVSVRPWGHPPAFSAHIQFITKIQIQTKIKVL